MGKGTIVGAVAGELGLYDVDAEWDTAQIDAERAVIQAEITALGPEITTAETERIAADNAATAAADALDAAITAGAPETEIRAKEEAARAAQRTAAAAYGREQALKVRLQALQSRLAQINAIPPQIQRVQAWSADYKIDHPAGMEVGLIETALHEDGNPTTGHPDETGYVIQPDMLITPSEAEYQAPRDGALAATGAQTSPQAAANFMFWPGAAKWRPRYRTGTLTAVDTTNNTVDVALDPMVRVSLDFNQATTLTGVPVEYMGIDAQAFAINDRVVVEFRTDLGLRYSSSGERQKWDNPTVIGFTQNPRSPILTLDWAYNGATLRADQLTAPITWYIWGYPNGFRAGQSPVNRNWVAWGADPGVAAFPQAAAAYSGYLWHRVSPVPPPAWCSIPAVFSGGVRVDVTAEDPLGCKMTCPLLPVHPLDDSIHPDEDLVNSLAPSVTPTPIVRLYGSQIVYLKAEDSLGGRQDFAMFGGNYRRRYRKTIEPTGNWGHQATHIHLQYPSPGFETEYLDGPGTNQEVAAVWQPNTDRLLYAITYNYNVPAGIYPPGAVWVEQVAAAGPFGGTGYPQDTGGVPQQYYPWFNWWDGGEIPGPEHPGIWPYSYNWSINTPP